MLGVVPVVDQARGNHGHGPNHTNNLIDHGGAVMDQGNAPYLIFWSDPGRGYVFDPGYIDTITNYFRDVSAGVGNSTTTNVYFSDTQYSSINVASTFDAASHVIHDSSGYPASGCRDKATKFCLSDGQLQDEVTSYTNAGWPVTQNKVRSLYFVFTPQGVGSCYGSSCAYTNFCAYHSWITQSTGDAILYANQPYAAQNYRIYTCDSGQHPNGNAADATLNVVSHEHNEAITDPEGTAWYDSQGAENGDKCAWNFGTKIGST